ncbi:hypothetical protein D3C78_1520890 [compost metagenome]
MAVADQVEQPAEAPGPRAAFVVIQYVDGVRAMAQLTEQRLHRAPLRQQAGRRRLAELGAFAVDVPGTGDVAFGVAGCAGQVDQDQFRCAQAAGQLGRLDQQRQVGKGGHGRLR